LFCYAYSISILHIVEYELMQGKFLLMMLEVIARDYKTWNPCLILDRSI
jgi:hypothetical protein